MMEAKAIPEFASVGRLYAKRLMTGDSDGDRIQADIQTGELHYSKPRSSVNLNIEADTCGGCFSWSYNVASDGHNLGLRTAGYILFRYF